MQVTDAPYWHRPSREELEQLLGPERDHLEHELKCLENELNPCKQAFQSAEQYGSMLSESELNRLCRRICHLRTSIQRFRTELASIEQHIQHAYPSSKPPSFHSEGY
jgi:hypothetical protein